MATPNNEKPIIVAFTLDFETGGLDCQDCACTQIAIHAVRIDTFETIDRYVKYISPYNKQPDKGVAKRKVLKSKFDKDDEQPMKLFRHNNGYVRISWYGHQASCGRGY